MRENTPRNIQVHWNICNFQRPPSPIEIVSTAWDPAEYVKSTINDCDLLRTGLTLGES